MKHANIERNSIIAICKAGEHVFCGVCEHPNQPLSRMRFFHYDGVLPINHYILDANQGRKVLPYSEEDIDECDWALLLPVNQQTARALSDFQHFTRHATLFDRNLPYYYSGIKNDGKAKPLAAFERKAIPALSFDGRERKDTDISPDEHHLDSESQPKAATNCSQFTLSSLQTIAGIDLSTIFGAIEKIVSGTELQQSLQGELSHVIEDSEWVRAEKLTVRQEPNPVNVICLSSRDGKRVSLREWIKGPSIYSEIQSLRNGAPVNLRDDSFRLDLPVKEAVASR